MRSPRILLNVFVKPIAELIAAPLTAACDSQKRLAQSVFEFMTEIGYADAEKQTPRLLSFNL